MRTLLLLAVSFVGMCSAASGDISPAEAKLVGTYLWSVPGSTWRLQLSDSGKYSLTLAAKFDQPAQPIESGTWRFEEFSLLLNSKLAPVSGDGAYRRLHVLLKKNGQIVLVSSVRRESFFGEPTVVDTLFDFVFVREEDYAAKVEKEANQSTTAQRASRVADR